jgi:hypothetical protein
MLDRRKLGAPRGNPIPFSRLEGEGTSNIPEVLETNSIVKEPASSGPEDHPALDLSVGGQVRRPTGRYWSGIWDFNPGSLAPKASGLKQTILTPENQKSPESFDRGSWKICAESPRLWRAGVRFEMDYCSHFFNCTASGVGCQGFIFGTRCMSRTHLTGVGSQFSPGENRAKWCRRWGTSPQAEWV